MTDNIVNKNNYINFIKNNKYLTECQKNNLILLKNNLNKNYVNRKSNIQISTYIKDSVNNIHNTAKIILLFNNFFSKKKTDLIIEKIKNNELIYDSQIINYIKSTKINLPNIIVKNNNKCSYWKYIFENLELKYHDIKNINSENNKNIKYLDIGCGNGKKTKMFAHNFHINKNNIYGTDIKKWGPYNQKNIKHDFHFKYILDDKIDFPDNSFDIITCFFVLHHILDLDKIMKEIRRVLKPGGYIIILEHDNHTDYDNILLDILHLLYGIYVDKNKLYLKNPDYAQYYNFMEWDYIFQKYGFKYIKSNYLFQEISHVVRYDNIYYAFYQKSMRNI